MCPDCPAGAFNRIGEAEWGAGITAPTSSSMEAMCGFPGAGSAEKNTPTSSSSMSSSTIPSTAAAGGWPAILECCTRARANGYIQLAGAPPRANRMAAADGRVDGWRVRFSMVVIMWWSRAVHDARAAKARSDVAAPSIDGSWLVIRVHKPWPERRRFSGLENVVGLLHCGRQRGDTPHGAAQQLACASHCTRISP